MKHNMRETTWTENQQNAINSRNGTVLVSAAAGSGKTAVLVERVVRRLTDEINPCSADKLLIVTFTNAATDEMKKRISKKLSEMIQNNPDDINLKRQQILIKRANIGTIHSFCNNVVRDNFYKLNISPNFRISENGEINVLKSKAMDTLMDEFYNKDDSVFLELVNTLSQEKNDSSLTDTIEDIYNFMRSFPFEGEWFSDKLSLYKYNEHSDISNSQVGKVIIEYTRESLEFVISLTRHSFEIVKKDTNMHKAYSKTLQKNLVLFESVYKSLDKDFDTIFESINTLKYDGTYDRKVKEIKDSPYKSIIDENKELINKTIKKIKSNFLYGSHQNRDTINKMYPMVQKLFELVKKFGMYLDVLKKEKNIADFNDLEKWTLKLLTVQDDKGKVTKSTLADELSKKFEEIMIDEYQDTNETQNMIFKMISKDEKNLFLVGDVKQSIYGFRQARPENFINKKNQYVTYNPNLNTFPAKIILDKNFRSNDKIINLVNFVFKNLMSEQTSGIAYNPEDYLVCCDSNVSKNSCNASLELVYGKKDNQNNSSEIIEANRIASLINDMIQKQYVVQDKGINRTIKYSDICILLRSTKNSAKTYSQQLNKIGIPCFVDLGENFFDTYEISTILSILKTIDNPIQDVPLIATLMSPIFGLTPDDISRIRLSQKDTPIYFAIKNLADSGDVVCKKFVEKINKYRTFAAVMTISELISHIYSDTGYTEIILAIPKGDTKLSNLRIFLDFAKKYQNDICKDLSEFLLFVDNLIDKKINPISASIVSEMSDEVRIMSIHKSKGLEFPVCILAGCSRQFNTDHKKVLVHPKLGVGFKLKDEKNIVSFNNLQRQAIKIGIRNQEIAENLRILYVALTRAKQKLIIVSHVEDLNGYIKKMAKLNDTNSNISPYIIKNCNCFLDWIILCALKSKSGKILYEKIGEIPNTVGNSMVDIFDVNISYLGSNNPIKNQQHQNSITNPNVEKSLINKISDRFNFIYPYSDVNKVPLKITATNLLKKDTWKENIALSRPAFMSKISISPGEKGTILHNFMYFANYNKVVENLDEYLSYMVRHGIMTQNEINTINKQSIKNFFSSDIGRKILKAKKLYREYRFTVHYTGQYDNLNFKSNTKQESPILIGSIDCVFEDDDGKYTIVDYKTDTTTNIEELSNKYARQLKIYKNAFERCENVEVSKLVIYSFHLNRFITII